MKLEKRIAGVLIFSALVGLMLPKGVVAEGMYKVDPVHSTVIFKISHFGVSHFIGRFNQPEGRVVLDENHPEKSLIDISVQAGMVDTANTKRDDHLKSPEFFNAEQFPLIAFKSRKVKKLSGNQYEVDGDLTLLGKTRGITVTADYLGSGKDAWGGYRSGFHSRFTIKRSDFGMGFMVGPLGDEVEITVNLEAVRE